MSKLKITTLPYQNDFIVRGATHTGLVAGYGAGKSEAGIMKSIIMKLRYPMYPVAYYLPSYPLIRDIAFPKFEMLLNKFNIQYTLNKTDKEFQTKYGSFILRSMDDPASIIGYEVAYSLIDEVDVLSLTKMNDIYRAILGRNRCYLPNNEINKTDVVGTPEGFRWFYKYYVKETKPNRKLIRARTYDNPFLPKEYIKTLEDSYTPEQVEAYLNGLFVNLNTGTVYKHFDRKLNHSDATIQEGDVLHIGMDFNIMNMNGAVYIIRNNIPIAVAELTKIYDTFSMIKVIQERFKGHSIVIYPDASGKNKSTSGSSDILLLKQANFIIRVGSKNPFVKDRVNSMNMSFCNNKGERNHFVNTDNCPVLTESLEQQSYKNGEPDKSSGFDHICEASGYFIHSRFGLKKRRSSPR